MVMDDLRKEIISHRTASQVFRLAYDPETLVVDRAGTDALRRQEREDRKARGLKWEDFIREWSNLRPAGEAMGTTTDRGRTVTRPGK
jgi:acetone carboxylase alpha subunit